MSLLISTFFKNRRFGLALCFAAVFALDLAGANLHAATINVPAGTVNAAQWTRLVNRAGNNGTLRLPAGTVTATQTLTIARPGIRVIGRGRGRSVVAGRGNLGQIFIVNANNVLFQNMQIRGLTRPRLTNLFRGSFLQDRPTLAAGINRGIFNRRNRDNLRILNCFIRDVNVGLEYDRNSLPHGLIVRRTDFACASGMVICTASRTAGPNDQQGNSLRRRMQIEAVRHTNRAQQIMDGNRNMGIRGLVFDFGNNAARRRLPAVNMRGTEIWNCNFIRTSKWNIDINRGHNCTIRNSTLRGGGWANASLNHTLHFEDAGNTGTPIVIRNNNISQMTRSSANAVISPPASHVWTGVTNADFAPALSIRANSFGGTVGRSLRLIKRAAGRDAQQLGRTAQIPNTVGGNVPGNQMGRRAGPAALQR